MNPANPPSLQMAMPFANLRQEASRDSNLWQLPVERGVTQGGLLPEQGSLGAHVESRDSRAATEVAKPPVVSGAVQDDRQAMRIALAASFTLEPVEPALAFWLAELGYAGEIEFAPYNQVLQQLIDPTS